MFAYIQKYFISNQKFYTRTPQGSCSERTNQSHGPEAITSYSMPHFLVCPAIIFLWSGLCPCLASHTWMYAVHVGQNHVQCWGMQSNDESVLCSLWVQKLFGSWHSIQPDIQIMPTVHWLMAHIANFHAPVFLYIQTLSMKTFDLSGYKQSAY